MNTKKTTKTKITTTKKTTKTTVKSGGSSNLSQKTKVETTAALNKGNANLANVDVNTQNLSVEGNANNCCPQVNEIKQQNVGEVKEETKHAQEVNQTVKVSEHENKQQEGETDGEVDHIEIVENLSLFPYLPYYNPFMVRICPIHGPLFRGANFCQAHGGRAVQINDNEDLSVSGRPRSIVY